MWLSLCISPCFFPIETFHLFFVLYIVPADAPANVSLNATSPFSIAVSWRPPRTPNGIIVQYTIYVHTSTAHYSRRVSQFHGTYLFSGYFQPYRRVNVTVSASTKIGEGPQSEPVIVRTKETSKSREPNELF